MSIYIHIPFCEQKCNYCAFNSFCATQSVKEEYLDLLCKELVARKTNRPVKTIYIGGGTPSVLSSAEIEKIVGVLYENYQIYEDAEFTIEANPNSITEELLKTWKKLRVNRLSIGVQSLSDKSLRKIGRLHDKKMALEKISLARKWFDNVSCDLIVGLENETGKDLCKYASMLLEKGIKHISCYLLEVYENSKLYKMVKDKSYTPLDDDKTIEAFNKLANYLVDRGFERYEISNFALPTYESQHNLNYWCRGDYLGFGLSAHSFVDGVRYENAPTIAEYRDGKVTKEEITPKEEVEEKIMLGLRCKLGVDLQDLGEYSLKQNPYFCDYLNQGILTQENDRAYLNPLYYHISNTIISNLLP